MKHFGTTTPDVSTRAQLFFNWWCEWKGNNLDIGDHRVADVRKTLKDCGLTEWEDFILKHSGLRFRHREDLALFKMAFAR
jgi:hypothetical protein